jgi:hypothetical protein
MNKQPIEAPNEKDSIDALEAWADVKPSFLPCGKAIDIMDG